MSAGRSFAVGTRASALALWQTERVRERLAGAGHSTSRIEIRTTGDVIQDVPLSGIGSRALFTRQIDDAMLAGRIDLAVHSLKDLPTVLPDGIALAAVSEREDPRDALVSRDGGPWATLAEGATVATSSLRRRAQLLHRRPDLRVADIRGNVDTRLAKLEARAEWSAIILACAGLVRLGQAHRISERLDPDLMLPAPGQGALAVTARADDVGALGAARAVLHHGGTGLAVAAERAFLRRLEGGCQVPVAAYAELADGALDLRGRVVALLGERAAEGRLRGDAGDEAEADALGVALAERLLREGADEILAAVRSAAAPPIAEP